MKSVVVGTTSAEADRRASTGRLGAALWSIGAQALSSTTNFGLSVVLLAAVSADELGRVLSIISVYLLALTLSRSIVSEPLVASVGDIGSGGRSRRQTQRRVLEIAAGAMLISTAVGLALKADTWSLVMLSGAMPFLLLQDGARYWAMAANRYRVAVLADGLWLLASGSMLGALVGARLELRSALIVGSWVTGGVASWVFVSRALPSSDHASTVPVSTVPISTVPVSTASVSRASSSVGVGDRYRLLAQSQVVSVTAVNTTPLLVTALLSPTLAAVAKAVLIPFTVLLSLIAGLRVVTLPTIRSAIDHGVARGAVRRLLAALVVAAGIGSALLVWGLGQIDPAVFGQSFVLAAPHLLLGGVLCVLYVVAQQLADVVALAGRRDVPLLRAIGVGLEWTGMLTGGAVAGVSGLVAGWTIGLALATGLWSTVWLRHRIS